jgi:hypothetical protein
MQYLSFSNKQAALAGNTTGHLTEEIKVINFLAIGLK